MQARQINALMATSGMYQNAGSLPGGWDYRQNLALVAVLWRLFRMKWYRSLESELDDAGNSLAGIAVLEQLTKQLGRSVY